MNRRLLAFIFLSTFALWFAATAPLAAVVPFLNIAERGLTYSRVEGTLWNGRISGVTWRGSRLGDAYLRVNPLSLMLARLSVDIALEAGTTPAGGGTVTLWPNGSVAITDFSLVTDIAVLPLIIPLKGTVALDVRQAEFSRGGCSVLDADVRTNALVDRPAGLDWQGPILAGTATCEDGTSIVPMAGGEGSETIALTVWLGHDGTFQMQIDARTADETVKGALSAIGFTHTDGTMTLTQTGRWG